MPPSRRSRWCRFVLVFAFALVSLIGLARATSVTTDQSDIWSTVGEDGWAIQFIQRGTAIFATIYVYDPSTNSIWYTAALESAGGFTWTGDLYISQGPWFGTVPFNSGAVHLRKVGTMTWTASSVTNGTLTYSVDGVVITKSLQRYLIRYDNFAGHYAGGVHRTISGCFNPALNGTVEFPALVYVAQNGLGITVQEIDSGGSCTYTGALQQAGQMGSAQGTYFCSDGTTGNFTFFEMQVNISGLTGRFAVTSPQAPGCQSTGWFGGVRGTTF